MWMAVVLLILMKWAPLTRRLLEAGLADLAKPMITADVDLAHSTSWSREGTLVTAFSTWYLFVPGMVNTGDAHWALSARGHQGYMHIACFMLGMCAGNSLRFV